MSFTSQAHWVGVESKEFLFLFEFCEPKFGDDEKAEVMGDIKQ